jgi:cobalt/nickel transport system permease protein
MTRKIWIVPIAAFALCILPLNAYAMHISEGILPARWAGLWYLASMPFVALGIYKLSKDEAIAKKKPLLGMMAAAVFIISCMPIPVPTVGTCSHPAGTAMAAILIGPVYSILAASVALLLQALFLAHGGITTWGANIFSMGVIGSLAGFAVFKGLRGLKAPLVVAAFFAGVIGDWATYATTSFELSSALCGPGEFLRLFYTILIAFVPTQLPLGIVEGFMTAGAVKFLYDRRPEFFGATAAVPAAGEVRP